VFAAAAAAAATTVHSAPCTKHNTKKQASNWQSRLSIPISLEPYVVVLYCFDRRSIDLSCSLLLSLDLQSATEDIRKEIDILKKVKHPTIVQYFGCCIHEESQLWV
jgi:serine/threonine protein kinase